MPDPSPRIPNAASTELAVDGLEGACLDRPASDVLDEAEISADVDDDTPSNVSD